MVHTDASEQGLGAVVYQRQNGKMRVIAYDSRTLSPTERNYNLHSGKLEFLALKWAVCEKFRDYLFYAPFTVYADNNPLTYVMSTAKLNAVGHQWVGELVDFRFDIKYRPGGVNIDADTLSRLPFDMDTYVTRCTEELTRETVQAMWEGCESAEKQDIAYIAALNLATGMVSPGDVSPLTIAPSELVKSQRKDPDIRQHIKLKESKAALTNDDRKGASSDGRMLMYEWEKRHMENQLRYRTAGQQLVLAVLPPGT